MHEYFTVQEHWIDISAVWEQRLAGKKERESEQDGPTSRSGQSGDLKVIKRTKKYLSYVKAVNCLVMTASEQYPSSLRTARKLALDRYLNSLNCNFVK